MPTIVFDHESYYDSEYSLRKMTPIEYILDPRWEHIGCAVKYNGGPTRFLDTDQLTKLLARLAPTEVIALSHNALFDMCVLAFRFGFVPGVMIDTMGMARALLVHRTKGVSLDRCAQALDLPAKGKFIANVIGMRKADIIRAGMWGGYSEYSCLDADLCHGVFQKLKPEFPKEEYYVMDRVIRAAVTPKFEIDQAKLHTHLAVVQNAKQELLDEIGVKVEDLMSNDRFAVALQQLGVDPPTKISLQTGKETFAFAKTDAEFIALQDHDDPDVQALVAARLGHKSTLEETRTERFISISNLSWPDGGPPRMPIALRYGGAHTHRLSGDWGLNQQNLPSRKGVAIRQSLVAPPGHKVVACDSAQVEARFTAELAGCVRLVRIFDEGGDPYLDFAEQMFGRSLTKRDKVERFFGKEAILGLGYGMGAMRFYLTVTRKAKEFGIILPPGFDLAEAQRIVDLYRATYPEIPKLWRRLNALLPDLAARDSRAIIGPCIMERQAILLPNGLRLFYHDLQYDTEWDSWVCTYAGKRKKLFGGKLLENIIQALARIAIMQADLVMRRLYPWVDLALQVHDELVYIVPDEILDRFSADLLSAMSKRVDWMPGVPIAAELHIADNYGDTK
jgi:DNA polymerase I-like protein with 3'-5' exonuclease and polymerase domains